MPLQSRMQEMLIPTLEDLGKLAERVLSEVGEKRTAKDTATVLALYGELGAGKTAFTQALSGMLGVTTSVTSPTFVIMRLHPINAHHFFKTLVHIDAYRIESLSEMEVIGFGDLLNDPANLICIEWAGKIEAVLPKDAFHITLAQSEVPEDGALRKAVYGYRAEKEEGSIDAHVEKR